MTLDELVEFRGAFIKDALRSFRFYAEKQGQLKGQEREVNFQLLLKSKYIIQGYIAAAFDYECISFEDKFQLFKELNAIIGL